MDPVHELNASRWTFLCENWNRKVNGEPFPVWLAGLCKANPIAAVDMAMAIALAGGMNKPIPLESARTARYAGKHTA